MLNACWHHGIDHPHIGGGDAPVARCSTPAGITESITLSHEKERLKYIECSTPAGITESITAHHDSAGHGVVVLNACWHHGIDHARAPGYYAHLGSGAQRLLASRNRSRR